MPASECDASMHKNSMFSLCLSLSPPYSCKLVCASNSSSTRVKWNFNQILTTNANTNNINKDFIPMMLPRLIHPIFYDMYACIEEENKREEKELTNSSSSIKYNTEERTNFMVFTLEIKHRKIPIVIARHGMLKGKFFYKFQYFYMIFLF